MPGQEHFEKIWANLMELGLRRLLALAIVGLTVIILVFGGAYYLSRPQMTILYSGLESSDISRIGGALQEAGIVFDVDTERTAVLVKHADAVRARTALAERGLPRGGSSGYELFDDIGSLGLTSFMQEVTRVRALEGEIARTIQSMKGITSARVHLVLPDSGSFRRADREPSASVVIRADSSDMVRSANSIRHLVAAAVPGLVNDRVTVLSVDGRLLATGKSATAASIGELASAEQMVSARVQESIRQSLIPYLGIEHFQVSVAAMLNTARERIAETIFDPDSRVERSVRTVRENESLLNSSSDTPTSVEQNLPDELLIAESGDRESEETQRREELVNYEISSKTVERSNDGYRVERLSIAVVIDRARLIETLADPAEEGAIENQINEVKEIVASAAGLDEERGDNLKISIVDFVGASELIEPVAEPSIKDMLIPQIGNLVGAVVIFFLAMFLIWFGLRPAINALVPAFKSSSDDDSFEAALVGGSPVQQLAAGESVEPVVDINSLTQKGHQELIEDLSNRISMSPKQKLQQILDLNTERSVAILRQWYNEKNSN